MNGSPISWKARTQIDVALSTCEAEYIGLSHCGSEAIYLTYYLEELGFPQDTVTCWVDNLAAKAICADDKHHQRTRHIRMRYHHTRHEVAKGWVRIEHMPGAKICADQLTKNVEPKKLQQLRMQLLTG